MPPKRRCAIKAEKLQSNRRTTTGQRRRVFSRGKPKSKWKIKRDKSERKTTAPAAAEKLSVTHCDRHAESHRTPEISEAEIKLKKSAISSPVAREPSSVCDNPKISEARAKSAIYLFEGRARAGGTGEHSNVGLKASCDWPSSEPYLSRNHEREKRDWRLPADCQCHIIEK